MKCNKDVHHEGRANERDHGTQSAFLISNYMCYVMLLRNFWRIKEKEKNSTSDTHRQE